MTSPRSHPYEHLLRRFQIDQSKHSKCVIGATSFALLQKLARVPADGTVMINSDNQLRVRLFHGCFCFVKHSLTMAPVPDMVVQEVRNLLSAVCRDACCKILGRGAKIETQHQFHEENFHRSPEHGCIIDTFLEGKTPHSAAFEVHEHSNNRAGNEGRRNDLLELHPLLHCDPKAFCCAQDDGLCTEDAWKHKNAKLNGRNLHDRGAKVCRHHKVFLKHFKECADSREGHPSGLVLEDMLMCVRTKIYVAFQGSQNVVGKTAKGKECTEEGMPEKHFPAGWFAFVLFGPMPTTGVTLACLSDDGKNVEKMSRADSRKLEAKAKNKGRKAGVGSSTDYSRGHSFTELSNVAFLAQQELANERRIVINLLHEANSDHQASLAELKEVRNVVKDLHDDDDDPDMLEEMLKSRKVLIAQLAELNQRKKDLQNKGKKLMEADPKRQVSSHFDSVGTFVGCREDSSNISEMSHADATTKSSTKKRTADGNSESAPDKTAAPTLSNCMHTHSQPPNNQEALLFTEDDNNNNDDDNHVVDEAEGGDVISVPINVAEMNVGHTSTTCDVSTTCDC